MPWTQYTRNFEDVMIRRVFQGVERGCFVDVGACRPIDDSNTYALYERGWRGIALEPQACFAPEWNEARPQDVFLCTAVGASDGEIDLYTLPEYMQSTTTRKENVDRYRQEGVEITRSRVPQTTLDAILGRHLGDRELHLLSIDVEGAEREVLLGFNLAHYRPWLLVIEATLPGTPTPSYGAWESIVLAAGYEFVHFDGVNRFYLSRERGDLRRCFALPPNVWDDFVSYRTIALQRMLDAERDRSKRMSAELADLRSAGIN